MVGYDDCDLIQAIFHIRKEVKAKSVNGNEALSRWSLSVEDSDRRVATLRPSICVKLQPPSASSAPSIFVHSNIKSKV